MDSPNTFDDSSVFDSAYAPVFDYVAPGLNTMVQDQQQSGESWIDSVARLLPIIAATDQQRQLLQVQVDRARQGLPPLNVSQYSAGVQVGMSSDLKQLLMIGGAAALAIMLFGAHRIGR
jgi:hypothetical protein